MTRNNDGPVFTEHEHDPDAGDDLVMGWRTKYEVHPALEAFPMMDGEPLAQLVEDIKLNGLRTAITVDRDGVLMDGRCRLEALELAGMDFQPEVETYDGDDPFAWIISKNAHRRHLTKQQRADAIVKALAFQRSAKASTEKLDQVEPVSRGGRGKVNETKAKAVSMGAALGISESTTKRSLAKAAGKTSTHKEPTGNLELDSILFPCSNLLKMTKAKLAVLKSKRKEIQAIVDSTRGLITYRERPDSLAKIEAAVAVSESSSAIR